MSNDDPRWFARAARAVGRKLSAAYHAVDPDVRLHVADLPLAATTMLGRRAQKIEAQAPDGYRPLVCIHGMSGHPQNFVALRGMLYLSGRKRFYSLAYDDGQPLEGSAAELAAAVEEILRVNDLDGDSKVDLVAHSLGGLVSRFALLNPAFARRVARFITIGTPHQGTLAARFAATDRALDLRPGSDVIKRLQSQVPWPGPPTLPPLVAYFSGADIMMLPATCATLEGADNREIPGVSHNGYLSRLGPLRVIAGALIER